MAVLGGEPAGAIREQFAALRQLHLKTGRAWAIKESLRDLWGYQRKGWALRHWKRWYFWATHSRLKPVVKVARTIRGHLDNVLTYFDHRITNATSEGLNSKIQTVKKTTIRERAKTPAIPDNAAPGRPGVTAVASWSAPSS